MFSFSLFMCQLTVIYLNSRPKICCCLCLTKFTMRKLLPMCAFAFVFTLSVFRWYFKTGVSSLWCFQQVCFAQGCFNSAKLWFHLLYKRIQVEDRLHSKYCEAGTRVWQFVHQFSGKCFHLSHICGIRNSSFWKWLQFHHQHNYTDCMFLNPESG